MQNLDQAPEEDKEQLYAKPSQNNSNQGLGWSSASVTSSNGAQATGQGGGFGWGSANVQSSNAVQANQMNHSRQQVSSWGWGSQNLDQSSVAAANPAPVKLEPKKKVAPLWGSDALSAYNQAAKKPVVDPYAHMTAEERQRIKKEQVQIAEMLKKERQQEEERRRQEALVQEERRKQEALEREKSQLQQERQRGVQERLLEEIEERKVAKARE